MNVYIENHLKRRTRETFSLSFKQHVIDLLQTVVKYRYPKRKELIRFVIFGQGRSGSTLLDSLLNSHPDVTSLDEALSLRHQFPFSRLEWLERRLPTSQKAFGFHLKPWHPTRVLERNLREFTHELDLRGFKYIHLKRENWFLKSLSQAKLRMYKVIHAHSDDQVPGEGLRVDPELLLFLIKEKSEIDATELAVIESLSYEPEEVIYERDLLTPEQQQATASRLFAALGLADANANSPLRKVSPTDWRLGVSNSEEIEQAVKAAGFDRFLS